MLHCYESDTWEQWSHNGHQSNGCCLMEEPYNYEVCIEDTAFESLAVAFFLLQHASLWIVMVILHFSNFGMRMRRHFSTDVWKEFDVPALRLVCHRYAFRNEFGYYTVDYCDLDRYVVL